MTFPIRFFGKVVRGEVVSTNESRSQGSRSWRIALRVSVEEAARYAGASVEAIRRGVPKSARLLSWTDLRRASRSGHGCSLRDVARSLEDAERLLLARQDLGKLLEQAKRGERPHVDLERPRVRPSPFAPAAALEHDREAALAELGLEPGATLEDVKRARRELARKHHPDVAGGDEAKMKAINAAATRLETILAPT